MIPHPPQPGTRCRRHDHAMWSDRKDTPTSPRPSPPLKGGEGEKAGALYVPSPPFRGGEGQGEVGLLFARCFATTCV